jgi:multiple sugar transport system substrate-binding protein
MKKSIYILMAIALMTSMILGACAPASTPTAAPQAPVAPVSTQAPAATQAPVAAPVELQYWLWDNNQQPAYQACADAFTKDNPNITIKITQQGWEAYWDGVNTGLVSGTAPDVFWDHSAKYPEFISKNVLLDIEPYVKKDNVDLSIYMVDPNAWVKDGKRYGLPKDWDTIAVFYNQEMFDKAGVDPAVMKTWTWNPKDGGTFQETMAKLTLDNKGRNGLDPAFDKKNVVQWGYVGGPGDAGTGGQQQWGSFAASNGFKLTDGPWTKVFHYDDPKIAETLQWWSDMNVVKGYMPSSASVKDGGAATALFQAKSAAMITDGSWMIGGYTTGDSFKTGIGKLPAGPEGIKTPIGGLSDAIWSGTKHPDEAWKWVKFLASPACANIVGDSGAVFPAQQSAVDKAIAKHKSNGVDVTAFTDEAAAKDGAYLLPMTEHGTEIVNLVAPVLLDIYDGKVKAADALPKLNEQINALFK